MHFCLYFVCDVILFRNVLHIPLWLVMAAVYFMYTEASLVLPV
jgi:hypothetical protein